MVEWGGNLEAGTLYALWRAGYQRRNEKSACHVASATVNFSESLDNNSLDNFFRKDGDLPYCSGSPGDY